MTYKDATKAVRLLRLLFLFKGSVGYSKPFLAEKFGVHTRTISRDIEDIQSIGLTFVKNSDGLIQLDLNNRITCDILKGFT